MTDHVHSYFWCGAGNWSGFSEVTAQADDLRKMRESSLSVWNEVIYLYEFQPSGTVYKKSGAGYMENPFWQRRKWKQS